MSPSVFCEEQASLAPAPFFGGLTEYNAYPAPKSRVRIRRPDIFADQRKQYSGKTFLSRSWVERFLIVE